MANLVLGTLKVVVFLLPGLSSQAKRVPIYLGVSVFDGSPQNGGLPFALPLNPQEKRYPLKEGQIHLGWDFAGKSRGKQKRVIKQGVPLF